MILTADPGLSGALAYYDGTAMAVRDMPVVSKPAGRRGSPRPFIDEAGCVNLLRACRRNASVFVLEQVGGMPGQGAHASFIFGYGNGVLIGAAVALGYRVERVAPATWKSGLRVPADKDACVLRASELLPQWAHLWPPTATKKQRSGRAEAALIALWSWQVFGPQQ